MKQTNNMESFHCSSHQSDQFVFETNQFFYSTNENIFNIPSTSICSQSNQTMFSTSSDNINPIHQSDWNNISNQENHNFYQNSGQRTMFSTLSKSNQINPNNTNNNNSNNNNTNTTALIANNNNNNNNNKKKSTAKSTYKHIPHREKPIHLVARRNARERKRVQAVNLAFMKLRKCVPVENRNKRLSKVKTLHRAIEYIDALDRLLKQVDQTATTDASETNPDLDLNPYSFSSSSFK